MANGQFASTNMALDSDDKFRASCVASNSYPCNLLWTRHRPSALLELSDKLTKETDRLFDGEDTTALNFLEAHDGFTRKQNLPSSI